MRSDVRGSGLAGTTNLALLARVREGDLALGFEPVSHLERLRRLLAAMHASRRNARESELRGSVFPDAIGRFGMISHFRYALVPPEKTGATRWHLSLNVGFDGGWEPYMRVIYRDIGALLDALLCHCENSDGKRYPGSLSDYDTYCRWVRSAEFDAGIYYTDSAVTVADRRYLASVERLQRENHCPLAADLAIAAHAEPDELTAMTQGVAKALGDLGAHLPLHLRTLKGLYRLTAYWAGPDGDILLRFAQLVLGGFQDVIAQSTFINHPEASKIEEHFADELDWLARRIDKPPPAKDPDWKPALLQAALLDDGPRATHGALVLLRVTNPVAAAAHLSSLAPRCAAPAAAVGQARLHVAFTMAGLCALQIHDKRLEQLPAEFDEGMEPRAGLLGDMRGNHPDHWCRPLRHGVGPAREDRIDLGVVHVAVMLRAIDAAVPGHALHPLLAAEVTALGKAGTGLAVLAVEPTRSRGATPPGRDHFGFVDGISQPRVVTGRAPDPRRHEVRPGELVLGFANDRGDGPVDIDDLLKFGSFLAVRKLRQRLDHLEQALDRSVGGDAARRTELLERMMGRRQNGEPLVAAGPAGNNDFDFRGPDSSQCPFASHVRRSNPRDGRPALPRILRRGMGYGPAAADAPADADRGTLFMAYCASIAEQFETVQRWVAGGNSSGVGSAQSDPLLGVPRDGEARVFRWVGADGAPQRAELGPNAFVELQWGLYLFVPALPVLERLADFRNEPIPAPAVPPPAVPPPAPVTELDRWRARLEDRDNGRATWKDVRVKHGGELNAPPYGRLVGTAAGVFDALADADCAKVSVQGFGERMSGLGVNHLGMDPADGHTAVGKEVNQEIEAIDEDKAFSKAAPVVTGVLAGIAKASSVSVFALRHPDGNLRLPVDLMNFAEMVVGALARGWFGLPNDVHMVTGGRVPLPEPPDASVKPRCPGHIIGPSRMIFGAHPHDRVMAEGDLHGPMVKKAVEDALAAGPLPGPGTITANLRARLAPLEPAHGPKLLEREVAGLLLGFAPTVYGNFLTVMRDWIESGRLWVLQQDLAERIQAGDTLQVAARAVLERPMLDTMQGEPVPPMVWRRPVVNGTPDRNALPVVLGLASAIESLDRAHERKRDALLFGGDYFAKGSDRWGLHACPGRKMGIGVMLALAAGLLDAGTLRPTGSPVLLMLTPKKT